VSGAGLEIAYNHSLKTDRARQARVEVLRRHGQAQIWPDFSSLLTNGLPGRGLKKSGQSLYLCETWPPSLSPARLAPLGSGAGERN